MDESEVPTIRAWLARFQMDRKTWYWTYYLRSTHWKRRKRLLHFWRGYTCAVCRQPGYDLHHMSYKHLFWEWFTDLVLLCRSCHDRVHNKEIVLKWRVL